MRMAFLPRERRTGGQLRAIIYHFPAEHPGCPALRQHSRMTAEQTLAAGSPIFRDIEIRDLPPSAAFFVETVDAAHGFALRQWQAMGSPPSPTSDQILLLRDFAWATNRQIANTDEKGMLSLKLNLSPWAVALIREIE